MRYFFLVLMFLVLAISPCLYGCGGGDSGATDVPSVGDPASEFEEAEAEEPDPDEV